MLRPFRSNVSFSPVHIREQMVGLHGGNHAQVLESPKIFRGYYLDVLNAETEIPLAALLFAQRECVQGHSCPAVPNGMKSKLEAGLGPFRSFLVEGVLLIARDSGVFGIIGVGGKHRSSVRAQGAIHKSLEHGGMQQRIIRRVMGLHTNQLVHGGVKGQPFGDAKSQLAFLFKLLISQEVFPLGVVLGGGDAPTRGILQGQFNRLAPLRGGWFGNLSQDIVFGRLPQDAGRLALLVMINLAALRIGALRGNTHGLKRCGIGDRDMPIHTNKYGRVVSGLRIDVLARGKFIAGPESMVPATPHQPFAGCSSPGAGCDASLHLLQGSGAYQIYVELLKAAGRKMSMSIVETGHHKVAAQINYLGPGALEFLYLLVAANGYDLS